MKKEKPPHTMRQMLTKLKFWEQVLAAWRAILRHLVSIAASMIVLVVILTQGDGDAIAYLREDAVTALISFIGAKIKTLI